LLKSSISSGAVAMIGLAPKANVAFADWLMTTLLVICAPFQFSTAFAYWPWTRLMDKRTVFAYGIQQDAALLSNQLRSIITTGYERPRYMRCPTRALERADDIGKPLCGLPWLGGCHYLAHNCQAVQGMVRGRYYARQNSQSVCSLDAACAFMSQAL
jgi:hypothetical protein